MPIHKWSFLAVIPLHINLCPSKSQPVFIRKNIEIQEVSFYTGILKIGGTGHRHMIHADEWENDPSIQFMRRVFKQMEAAQKRIFEHLKISPFDPRLKYLRKYARRRFEDDWRQAVTSGINLDEDTAAEIYMKHLVLILREEGINVP